MSHYDFLAFLARNPDWPIVFFAGCLWGIAALVFTGWVMIACMVAFFDSFDSYMN